MFFRIISSVIFSIAGGIAGFYFSERIKNQLELCHIIQRMLSDSKVMIRCYANDVYSLVAELKKNISFNKLTFLNDISESYNPEENFHTMWSAAVNLQKDIPDDIRKILYDFGDIVGKSDIEGQISSIDSIIESMVIIEKNYSEIYSQKSRLYRSVGLLFGIMIGILII